MGLQECKVFGAKPTDAINPAHYQYGDYEPRKVIAAWGLNFHLGSALKYICRQGKKPGVDPVEDLRKAIQYLQFEIEALQAKAGKP